ncbi:hypothetical protein Tco_1051918 [Tanacetum coccineum]
MKIGAEGHRRHWNRKSVEVGVPDIRLPRVRCHCSFTDILNMDHFMNRLEDNIYTIRELPDEYAWSAQEIYVSAIRSAQVKNAPFRASAGWCLENVAPGFESYRIVVLIWLCWIPEDAGKE